MTRPPTPPTRLSTYPSPTCLSVHLSLTLGRSSTSLRPFANPPLKPDFYLAKTIFSDLRTNFYRTTPTAIERRPLSKQLRPSFVRYALFAETTVRPLFKLLQLLSRPFSTYYAHFQIQMIPLSDANNNKQNRISKSKSENKNTMTSYKS